jgi:hypothetical protein
MAQSDTSTGGDGPQLAPGMFPEDFDVSSRGDVQKLRQGRRRARRGPVPDRHRGRADLGHDVQHADRGRVRPGERYHRDEVHWWKTRLAPLLALISQGFVVYLLFTNIGFLGASTYSYAYWLGPIDLAVVLIGIGVAIYYKRRKPEKYEQAGRLINEGL